MHSIVSMLPTGTPEPVRRIHNNLAAEASKSRAISEFAKQETERYNASARIYRTLPTYGAGWENFEHLLNVHDRLPRRYAYSHDFEAVASQLLGRMNSRGKIKAYEILIERFGHTRIPPYFVRALNVVV